MTQQEYLQLATERRFCICLDALPMIPLRGRGQIKPSPLCPLHKTLAQRWKSIKSWQSMADAINADKIEGERLETVESLQGE